MMRTKRDLILFDGYGTLFAGAFDNLLAICDRIARENRLDMDARSVLELWDGYFFPMVREGTFVTMRTATRIGLERAFADLNVHAPAQPYTDQLFDCLAGASTFPDVHPTLAALDGMPQGVVSNADSDHLMAAIERNGLGFPVVVTSESARSYKPNPEIFSEALTRFERGPEEAIYVGDSQEDDIVGAKGMGIQVAWLNRTGERLKPEIPEPDYEIRSLRELLKILRK